MSKKFSHHIRKLVSCLAIGWLSFAGCTFGPSVSDHTPARSGAGLSMSVTLKSPLLYLGSRYVSGELLSVSDTGLILLMQSEQGPLVLVPTAAIEEGRSTEDKGASFGRSGITPAVHERIRLQSRFPQGLSDDVLRRMLDLHGQQEVGAVRKE